MFAIFVPGILELVFVVCMLGLPLLWWLSCSSFNTEGTPTCIRVQIAVTTSPCERLTVHSAALR